MRTKTNTLEEFYKDYFSWSALNIGQWMVTGIMEFALGIFLWLPYQEMVRDDMEMLGFVAFFGILGAMCYLLPYIQLQEGGKVCKLYDKLKYLPISLQEIRVFCLKRLARFCVRMFLIFFIGQLFFALVAYHKIAWGNIWYPVVFGLLIPMAAGSLTLWGTR